MTGGSGRPGSIGGIGGTAAWTPALPRGLRIGLLAAAALGGIGLGVVTGTVAALRHDRPMHAVGRTYHARLEHLGSADPSGVAWIDQPRVRTGLVRFSRGAGLPGRYPDFQGLAIRLQEPRGRTDLLLTSSGLRGPARFVLVPRRSPLGGAASTLMPFRAPGGPVVIAAVPVADEPVTDASVTGEPVMPDARAEVVAADARRTVRRRPRPGRAGPREADPELTGTRWRLLWSGLTGPWRPFAVLTVGDDAGAEVDRRTRFHPVTATPPGLPSYLWARLLRSPAYRAAQLLGRPRPAGDQPASAAGPAAAPVPSPTSPSGV